MTHPPSPDDLLAHALGRLDPPDRERVERALAVGGEARARHEAMVRHLARWDGLGAPPPPPAFAALRARLDGTVRGPRSWRPRVAVLVAAAAVLAVVVLATRGPSPAGGRPDVVVGAGLRLETRGGDDVPRVGDVLVAERVGRARLGPRVVATLDAGTRLALGPEGEATLEAGRVHLAVDRRPFRVRTVDGDVTVEGTAFEVDVADGALAVRVEEGTVRVGDVRVEAGRGWTRREGLGPAGSVGAWFRRPRLRLVCPAGGVRVGETVALTLELANPTAIETTLPLPDGVRTATWLRLERPDGTVEEVPLTEGAWTGDGRVREGVLHLPPGGVARRTVRWAPDLREGGVHACRAMYRPRDDAPLLSEVCPLEVRR